MSSPLATADQPKPIATKRPGNGHIAKVFESEAATGAAEYLSCWITGHGQSINDPASCPYCAKPIGGGHFALIHCPCCGELVVGHDLARDYCPHCDISTTPVERAAWIINAELGKREQAVLRVLERDRHTERKQLFAEPESAKNTAHIAAYSLDGACQVATLSYKHAVRWVASGVAHWCDFHGVAALRMLDLMPLEQPFWANASITAHECEDNALKSFFRVPALSRDKVEAWPQIGVDPCFGKPPNAPMLVWRRCRHPFPGANMPAVALQTARIMAAKFRSLPPAETILQPTWRVNKLNREGDAPGMGFHLSIHSGHADQGTTVSKPTTRVGRVIETTRAIIRILRKQPDQKMTVGFRPAALNVRNLSDSEVKCLPSLVSFADEQTRELDLSREHASRRLAVFLAGDCEGDKSLAGEVQPSAEEITLSLSGIDKAILDDVEQGDAFDNEGNAPDPDGSAAAIATWECDKCLHSFDLQSDDRPDCCPYCESANFTELPWAAQTRSEEIRWDIDPSNKTEEPLASDDQEEIPAILADAAGLDGNLEELRKLHTAEILQDAEMDLSQTWTDPQGTDSQES